MRLVLATPLYPPEIGGPATYAKALVEGLPARGIEVELVKFSDVRRWPRFMRHVVYERRLVERLRTADAVLALDPVSTGLPAMRAARAFGKPFFLKIVGDYAWEQGRQRFGVRQTLDEFVETPQRSPFVRVMQRTQVGVAVAATKIIVPSQYLKKIVTAWGIPEGKIEVIHNGIELPEELPSIPRPDGFLVVSSGRRVPWKNFEGIERAVAREPEWHLHVASGVVREEALAWTKAADAYVLNSTYEGLPHALIEAMLLGTPVVATAAGGNTELVTDGVTGLLVPVGDDDALHEALRKIQDDPEGARARAAQGRARMAGFSIAAMLDATAVSLKHP